MHFKFSIALSLLPHITELGWTTIEKLVYSESKVIVYKSQYELVLPQYFCNMLIKNSHCCSLSLRNTDSLEAPHSEVRGAKLLNSLSVRSKQATTLNAFKASILKRP